MSWLSLKHVRPWVAQALAGLGALALGLGGCGGDDAPTRSVRLDAAADGSLRFDGRSVATQPGRVRIEMANPADIPHAMGIRGAGVDEIGETVGNGGTSSVDATVRRGRYTLFCPVGGHEQAGMVAALVVE